MTYIQIHRYIHTYIHSFMHTYIHTYIHPAQTRNLCSTTILKALKCSRGAGRPNPAGHPEPLYTNACKHTSFICVYVCTYVLHVCTYACSVCVYVCMYVCLYLCTHVCMNVRMYLCKLIYIYACACELTNKYAMHICAYVPVYTPHMSK